eukprot:6457046-Amphidinium_carterae.1
MNGLRYVSSSHGAVILRPGFCADIHSRKIGRLGNAKCKMEAIETTLEASKHHSSNQLRTT